MAALTKPARLMGCAPTRKDLLQMRIEHELSQVGLQGLFDDRCTAGYYTKHRGRDVDMKTGELAKPKKSVMGPAFQNGGDGDISVVALGDQRFVAAKTYRGVDNATSVRLALKEAQLLRRFADPDAGVNIAPDGSAQVRMRLASGSLHEVGHGANIAPHLRSALARKTLRDVADQLVDVHGCGYIHRDIKPGNILCYSDGSLRLADFGRARGPEDKGRSGMSGTLMFAPVEVLFFEPGVSPSSDIWSLGMTLLDTLVGLKKSPAAGEFARANPAVMAVLMEDLLALRERLLHKDADIKTILRRDSSPWAPYLRRTMRVDPDLTRFVLQTMLAPQDKRSSADALAAAVQTQFSDSAGERVDVEKLCAGFETDSRARRAKRIVLDCTYDAVVRKRVF